MRTLTDKCFIISEIGEPGSPERDRADKFKRIIIAALDEVNRHREAKIAHERLDGDRSVASFFDQVLDRVISYRLVAAVLSNRNPNAHLELGLALAAGRPVSILIERHKPKGGQKAKTRLDMLWDLLRGHPGEQPDRPARFGDLPSDLKGYDCIECDLPDAVDGPIDQSAVASLADKMRAQLKAGEPLLAFGRRAPFGKRNAVDYMNRANEMSFDQWSKLLWDAEKHISMATTSFRFLVDPGKTWFYSRSALRERDKGVQSASDRVVLDILIQKAALEGVRVRLFLINPDNPFLEHLVYRRAPEDQAIALQQVRNEISENLGLIRRYLTSVTPMGAADADTFLKAEYTELDIKQGGSLELIEVRRGSLFSRVTVTDKAGFITPYQLIEPFNTGPSLWMQKTMIPRDNGELAENNLYVKTLENLDELYACNSANAEHVPAERLRARFHV